MSELACLGNDHDYAIHQERDLLWCRKCGATKLVVAPPQNLTIEYKVTGGDLVGGMARLLDRARDAGLSGLGGVSA